MPPKDTLWDLDPHTQAKHIILEKYLSAWIPILSSNSERLVIFDGFAGPGEYKNGELGSPIIAIDTLLKHSARLANQVEFIFVEDDARRREHLEKLIQKRYQVPIRYRIFAGTFIDTLPNVLQYVDSNRTFAHTPTFALLDPFGFSHTPMDTITQLMQRPKFEVLITFMYEWINRFIDVDYTDKAEQYDGLFGSPNWRELVDSSANPAEREQLIHDFYRNQLRTAANIRYIRSFGMQSERGGTVYYLFFGTNHLLGLRKMKEAMLHVAPNGTYQFSDRTDPNQLVFFNQLDYRVLQQQLKQQFAGQTVSLKAIEQYVLEETPFINYKKEALRPLELASPPGITVISSKTNRSRGTFADVNEIKIHFP